MEKYKLGEISEFIRNGASIKQFDNADGYPITRIETISNFKIDFEKMGYANIYELGKYEDYLLKNGDILMSHINSDVHLGKSAVMEDDSKKIIHGMNLLCIRLKKEMANSKYMYYYFNHKLFRNKLSKIIKKSVNQASFSVTDLKKIDIEIPNIETQKKIVEVLDKAQFLIDKKKEQIELLDELVKSRFIEMFGDPKINPKNWTIMELKNLMLLANNGLSRRGNDEEGNIVLRLVELQNGYIDYTNVNRIKLTESEEKRYLLKEGDFLFARVNGNPDYVGRCAYFKNIGENVFHNDHIIRVRFDSEILNNDYVTSVLNSKYGKLQMKDKLKTSAGQYTINQTGISEIKIPIPPMELQNEFAEFVTQIDSIRSKMEASLSELEDNFNSLMQKAFKGELF